TTAKGEFMRAGKTLAVALALLPGGARPFGVAQPRRVLVKTTLTLFALAAALLGGLAPAAHAGLILQPAAASTDIGSIPGGGPDSPRNQSGLSAGYTSLVTDFAAYLAGNPTHNMANGANGWFSFNGTVTGNFDFDLGGSFTIESFALWGGGVQGGVSSVVGF